MMSLLAPRSLGRSIDFCQGLPAAPWSAGEEEFGIGRYREAEIRKPGTTSGGLAGNDQAGD
jgi:hypothetical protein